MALSLPVGDAQTSGLWLSPERPQRVLVLAHSAGRDMREPFLEGLATSLVDRGVASLRFQFLHVERGEDRPASPGELNDAAVAAVAEAGRRAPGVPLFSGGKSIGGRINAQVSAHGLIPEARGILLLGFPLHPEGKPSSEKSGVLDHVQAPMLFVQGEDDALASLEVLRERLEPLGSAASLQVIAEANHGYEPLEGSARTPDEILAEVTEGIVAWMEGLPTPS